ncbi:polyprenyl glycosylphosphotransferase [Candidatus Parcubacteria bacterium]|nr:MAG: polyprenyl glycosylphosphotransferase [Candidatus Parcubacteria bacterium]
MRKLVLFIGDVVLLYASLAATLWLRYGHLDSELWQEHLGPFSLVFAIWIIVFFINRLYEIKKTKEDFKFYGQLIQNLVINGVLAVLIFYIIAGRFSDIRPQTILVILLLVFAVLFLLWRKIFYQIISGKALQNNLAIVGISPESLLLAEEVITKPELSYKLQLIVNPDSSEIPEKFHIVPVEKDISNLKNQLLKNKINTVVAVNNPKYSPEVARYLFESIELKIQYFNLTDFYEKITGKIPITALERNWFLENISQKNNQLFATAKRIIDILFAVLFGLMSLILIPFIALLIKLESKGPLIYKQTRIGLNNKIFTVYKFRSMVQNAEKDGAQWAQKNDTRITKIGKFMRKTRLDEIPQFWNIIIGNMSFVGPRPERPEFVDQLKEEVPYYNERHLVKPGLSGWAQINYPYGASIEDAKQKLQYDLFYIKNQSIALDISIILKTINTLFNITLGR